MGYSKIEFMNYDLLLKQLQALLSSEKDFLANLANFSAFVFHELPQLNWAGFYRVENEELILGPFQGKVACTRLKKGKGVCWAAAEKGQTVLVPDVHQFPGHIACDAASQSEIVVPIFIQNKLWGVLDIDSPIKNRFTTQDQIFLQQAVEILLIQTHFPPTLSETDLHDK